MKDFYNSKTKNDYNYFERFLIKFFISLIFILVIVILEKFNVINYDKLKNKLSDNINVIPAIQFFDNNGIFIPIEKDDTAPVSSQTYSSIIKNDHIYTLSLGNYQAVENINCGVVVKIEKKNDVYNVDVKGKDNNIYHYMNLKDINVNIYQLLNTHDIIGSAQNDKDNYYFMLKVTNKGEIVDYFS